MLHIYTAQVWPVCNEGITVLPATDTRTCKISIV